MEDFNALYYRRPYVKEFDAAVTACTKTEHGYEITLSDTAFYPEGGGQPGDRGMLSAVDRPENAVRVSDTQFAGSNIVHIADAELPVGVQVYGIIDWENRCDNMEAHSGEHILTGVIHQIYGYENIGFHIGAQYVTIDFNGPLTQEQVLAVEQRANAVIRENLPLLESFPTDEERRTMQYRSKKEITGTVRIITIPGLDACACCGTHVSATGEVGLIKIISVANRKKGVRLEVLCGRKALLAYEQELLQVQAISRCLSAKPTEIREAVEKLSVENATLKQRLHEMTQQYLQEKVDAVAETAPLYIGFEEDVGIENLRYFCNRLLAAGKAHTCAALSEVKNSSDSVTAYNYVIVSNERDLKLCVKTLNQRLNGRGGGNSSAIQGTYYAEKDAVTEMLREVLG